MLVNLSESGFKGPVQLRRSSREKQPSKGFEFKSYAAERERALFHLCSGMLALL